MSPLLSSIITKYSKCTLPGRDYGDSKETKEKGKQFLLKNVAKKLHPFVGSRAQATAQLNSATELKICPS
jgi:hypothetical protein